MDSGISAAQEEHRSVPELPCPSSLPQRWFCLSLPAPALQESAWLFRHGASHSWTAAAGLCPIPCCCQWHFPCSRRRAWCGEGSRCMVGIFPASVCAGGGWCRSAELGALWVQPCLRRPPGVPQGSSQPQKAGRAHWTTAPLGGGGFGQGDGSACARHPGCVSCASLLHQLLPGPSLRATLPRLPRGISGFHCCAELPSLPLRLSNPLFPAVFQPGKACWLPVRSVLAAPASRGPRAAPAAPCSEWGTAIFGTATQDVILAASSSHRHLLPLLSLTLSFSPPPFTSDQK